MICGFTGSTATAPVFVVHSASVSGVHEAPLFVLFHTPPDAAPMYIGPPTVVAGTIAEMRPASSPPTVPKNPPAGSQNPLGPIGCQAPPSGTTVADAASLASVACNEVCIRNI